MVDADVVVVVSVDACIEIIGVILPAPTSKPLLAVATPIESKNVTSSYVIVPPIVTFPVNVAAVPVILPATLKSPDASDISPNKAVLAIPTHPSPS